MIRRLLVLVAIASASITAQSGPPKGGHYVASEKYVAPRTPWGDPDLSGMWPGTAMMGVPLERPASLGDKGDETIIGLLTGAGTGPPGHWGERGKASRQTSLVVDPPDGRIPPMTAEGQSRTAAIPASRFYDNSGAGVFNGPEDLSVYDRCITRGLIGSMVAIGYNAGNQIVQSPGWVAIRNEMIHEARVIPLDGRKHASPAIRTYMGDSVGRWDGATLVVDTTNFNGRTGIGANGRAIYHSDALHVVERFTRVDGETIQYEAKIDDPKTWTRAFTIAFPLTREPGYGMFEYACHEGNYGLRNILSAARAADNRSH